MAESENLQLRAYSRFEEGKPLAYVRAGTVVNARPEAGRVIIRMRDDVEVGMDAMPGAFAARTPQVGDMYVVEPDGTGRVWPLQDFIACHRAISDHEIPGAPAYRDPATSLAPAMHVKIDPDNPPAAFGAAAPTSPPPLDHWQNPEDAPKDPNAPPAIVPPAPPRTPDMPPAPPGTPIDMLSERANKLNPNVEQPALSGGFVSTGGEMTARDAALTEAKQHEAERVEAEGGQKPEADPGFGRYTPGPDRSTPEQDTGAAPRSVPLEVPQDQVEPAEPSDSAPVSAAAPLISDVPPNAKSTIQYRDPAEHDADPLDVPVSGRVHPAQPTDDEGKPTQEPAKPDEEAAKPE